MLAIAERRVWNSSDELPTMQKSEMNHPSRKSRSSNTGYMLDTSAFNQLVDEEIDPNSLAGLRLFATHVQRDELAETPVEPDETRLPALVAMFETVFARDLPTETAVWGDSRWGKAKWGSSGLYERLLARVEELDRKSRSPNQSRDARIAETAIKNGLVLVTNDGNLTTAAREHGCKVLTTSDLITRAGNGDTK